MNSLATIFIDSALKRFGTYKLLAEKTFDQLDDAQLHYSPNETSNSIAVIIRHMAGNMLSRWSDFLSTDGEKEWRDRDGEFEITGWTKAELLAYWEKGWSCCLDTIAALSGEELLRNVSIRGEALTVTDAINRQLAHYAYHVGQIVYIGKILKHEDWKNLSIPKKTQATRS